MGKKSDYQEDKFWQARRSLRLWPIENGDRTGLEEYLRTKLRMDERFVKEELGEVTITKPRDPRSKDKDKAQNEYVVTFENKQVRDEVKAAASNLANFREEAGMKLHVPDHLRRDFQTLMNLSYDLKKKNPDLKRNIKFDEDDLGLYMDLKLKKEGQWNRVKPSQAQAANKNRGKSVTKELAENDLRELLEASTGSESEDEDE